MRTFADPTGIEWTVYEVRKKGGAADRWSYLPEQFGGGWLCFESDVSKRRLTPIPHRWRDFSDRELQGLLTKAQTVNRPRSVVDDVPIAD
jgi:hypothetical protein